MEKIKNSEVAILIMAGNPTKYKDFIDIIKDGWYKEAINLGFKVFFYSGSHNNDCIHDSCEIHVKEDDALDNCYRKFIAAKDVLKSNFPEIKLIFRTTVSSYIDIENFVKYMNKVNFTKRSIHGVKGVANKYSEFFFKNKLLHVLFKIIQLGPKINFYSGGGFFIGMELCDELSFDPNKHYLIDDVEIGLQIKDFVVHNFSCERIYITDNFAGITKTDLLNLLNSSLLFHYKFKTKNRSHDAYLLKKFSDAHFRMSYLTKNY